MTSALPLVALTAALCGVAPQDPAGTDAAPVAEEEAAFRAAAEAAAASVVRIETLGGVDTAGGRLLASGPSTGTVVREDGLILTSSENLAGNPTSILVRWPNGERAAAERLGEDEPRQLTLLRAKPPEGGAVAATPAAVADLQVGDWAIAVGRTYSAERVNVSVGVVSAKDRILGRAVQTDAKVSPANYGGPLIDLTGRTVGVLAPLSAGGGRGGVEWYDSGIGFAVPLADLLPVLDRLADGETLRAGKLGVTFKSGKLDAEPVLDTVALNSPAESAGLLPGDRLLTVAGRPVARPDGAKLALGPRYAGDLVTITADRDGETVEVSATLVAELPPWRPGDLGVLPGEAASDGESAEGEGPIAGVRIAHVFPGSAADGALAAGEVVTAADGEPVETAADLRRVVSRRPPGTELTLERAEGGPVTVILGDPPDAPPAEVSTFVDPASDPLPEDESGRLPLEVAGFEDRGGSVRVPSRTGRRGLALLTLLPGGPAGSPDEAFERFGPAADRHGVILLAPRGGGADGTFGPADLPFLAAAAELMRDRYAVERTRSTLLAAGSGRRNGWQIALRPDGDYRGLVTDAQPTQLPANDPQRAVVPLLLGPPPEPVREALRSGGFPFAVLEEPTGGPDAAERLTDEAVDAVVRWAASVDRI